MDLYDLSTAQSLASFYHYNHARPENILKPIDFSTPSHFHRYSKRNNAAIERIKSREEIPESPQKGIIFEWPQRRTFYYEKELCLVGWIIAHALYWLHIIHILPCGTALYLKQPPWKYTPPLPKPENRDYIIEPDWDSCYI